MKETNLYMVFGLLIAIALGCGGMRTDNSNAPAALKEDLPKKLETYEFRGLKFAYFKIPAGLSREKLVETATKLHHSEPDTQLILVDDDTRLADYVAYAKALSTGNYDVEAPQEWADEHIVANVQKYTNGRYVLCEGNGYKEIAELK